MVRFFIFWGRRAGSFQFGSQRLLFVASFAFHCYQVARRLFGMLYCRLLFWRKVRLFFCAFLWPQGRADYKFLYRRKAGIMWVTARRAGKKAQ